MSELDTIIQINITSETSTVTSAAFNIMALLSAVVEFPERARTYSSLIGVAEDFATTSPVYKMADQVFSQNPRITTIVVGKRQVDGVAGNVSVATENGVYSLIISGETFTYTADGDDTVADIVTALKTAYDSDPVAGVNFTDNEDGTFVLAVATQGTAWSVKQSSNITVTKNTPTESWEDAKNAILLENDSWFGAVSDAHTDNDILALADALSSERKIYVASTSATTVPSASTSDLGSQLEALGYENTMLIYKPDADTQYPEAAIMSKVLSYPVGSATWNFKPLQGVTPDNLSQNQITYLQNKNVSWYKNVAGVSSLREGLASNGRPLDEFVIRAFIIARMQEQIYGKLVRQPKVFYTKEGFLIIENEMRDVLFQIQNQGGILPGWTVKSPDPRSIPENMRSLGIAGIFTFSGIYQGAVRTVQINGNLTI